MLGGLGAYIASEISGVVRRNTIVFGLYGFAAVLLFCAGGYGLNAVHTILTFRLGQVAASLWIAGGLMLAALIAIGVAAYVKSRKRPSRPMASTALLAAPVAVKLLGSRIGWRTAALGGVVILGALLGKQLFTGGDGGDEEA